MCNICNNSWCNGGCRSNYNFNNPHWCETCHSSPCTCSSNILTCGCPENIKSDCIFYSGATTSCLGITTNSTLTSIIQAFDAKFCTITPSGSSGGCTIVNGTTSQIISTPYSSGICGGYIVSLSPVITTQINTNTANIAAINTALLSKTDTITTNTPSYLTLTQTNSHTWNIDYLPPSVTYSGILYSDYSVSGTINSSWDTLKTYTIIAGQLATNGDTVEGKVRWIVMSPSGAPTIRIQFNNVTLIREFPMMPKNINVADGVFKIVRISNTQVDVTLELIGGVDNGSFYETYSSFAKSYVIPFTGLNLSITAYTLNVDGMCANLNNLASNILELTYLKKI